MDRQLIDTARRQKNG